jgi:hypothetical protein
MDRKPLAGPGCFIHRAVMAFKLEFITLFLIKQRPFLFELNITHSNRGRFYSKSEVFNLRNGLNSTFPSK